MAKLLITTQVYENYGDAANPHWKAKGGGDYVVKKFRGNDRRATETVMALRGQIEADGDGYREHIIGWEVVADDYLTAFERSQLEYEGRITSPAVELTLA